MFGNIKKIYLPLHRKQILNLKTSNYGLFKSIVFRATSTFRSFKT